ncbi:TlpA disulfide reductase family protein [Arachidicoccus ginsenosidivorans]
MSPPKEGQTAPLFVAKDVEDNDVDLNKLNGKYILLDFWATWCGPCMAAVPLVKKLRANFSSDSLVIIGINKDNDFNKFKKEIEQSKMNWRQIFDNKNIISSLYGVTAIPVTLLINKHGVIIYRSLGLSINNEKQIESFLKNN